MMPDATASDHAPPAAPARPRRERRRFRVGLRGLMILVLLIGAPLGWTVGRATLQRRAVARVQALGGRVLYEDQIDPQGFFRRPHRPWGPAWLHRAIGTEWFEAVAGVVFESPGGRLRVDDESIAVVNEFPRLRRLSVQMHGGRVEGESPARPITAAGLARLTGGPQFRELSLYRLDVDAALVRLLPRWPALEEVAIIEGGRWMLDASCLEALGKLPRLRKVQIYSLDAPAAEDMAPLLGLEHLEHLMLARSPREGAWVADLKSLPTLTSLYLPETAPDAATLAAVARCPNLVDLAFDGSRLGPGDLKVLGRLQGLRYLTITMGNRSNDPIADHTHDRVPARFGDADLDALRGLPLAALSIKGLDATDAAVARLLAGRSFVELSLGGRGITDATIPLLAGQVRLNSLALADTGITDAGLARLGTLPALTRLSLVDNPAVTDAGMGTLRACPTLDYLTYRQPGTRPATIHALRAGRPRFNVFEPPAEGPVPPAR